MIKGDEVIPEGSYGLTELFQDARTVVFGEPDEYSPGLVDYGLHTFTLWRFNGEVGDDTELKVKTETIPQIGFGWGGVGNVFPCEYVSIYPKGEDSPVYRVGKDFLRQGLGPSLEDIEDFLSSRDGGYSDDGVLDGRYSK